MYEPIILVHGTFANEPQAAAAHLWWHPLTKEPFQTKLDRLLAAADSTARCWEHVKGDPTRYAHFEWSGKNSERERRAASHALRDYLLILEQDPYIRRYHLICHSHGGYIASRAIVDLATGQPHQKLGQVVFLGSTFFLSRNDRWLVNKLLPHQRLVSTLGIILGALFIAVSITLFIGWGWRDPDSSLCVSILLLMSSTITFLFGCVASRFSLLVASFVRRSYPDCKPVLISSRHDEARSVLMAMAPSARSRYAAVLTDYFMRPVEQFRYTKGIFASRTSWFDNLVGRMPLKSTAVDKGLFRRLVSRSRHSLAAWFSRCLEVADASTRIVAYVVAHCSRWLTTRSIPFAVRTMSKLALGDDLFLDRIEQVGVWPMEYQSRSRNRSLPESVEENMRQRALRCWGTGLDQTYSALPQSQFNLATVWRVFTDVELVHSQYMRDEDVIQCIAAALKESP